MKTISIVLFSLLVTQVSLASADLPSLFIYNIFKDRIFNLDSALESSDLKLKPETCHYKSFVSGKEGDFSGLGPCLYESLVDGFATDGIPGVITSHLKVLNSNISTTLVFAWRPVRGGRIHLLKRLYDDWRRKPAVGEKEGLLGTLVIDFTVADPKVISEILGPVESFLPLFLKSKSGLSQIRLTSRLRAGNEIFTDTLVGIYSKQVAPAYKLVLGWDFFIIPPYGTVHINLDTVK